MTKRVKKCVVCGARAENQNPAAVNVCCSHECREIRDTGCTREELTRTASRISPDEMKFYDEQREKIYGEIPVEAIAAGAVPRPQRGRKGGLL